MFKYFIIYESPNKRCSVSKETLLILLLKHHTNLKGQLQNIDNI